jgi:hypothetical protein
MRMRYGAMYVQHVQQLRGCVSVCRYDLCCSSLSPSLGECGIKKKSKRTFSRETPKCSSAPCFLTVPSDQFRGKEYIPILLCPRTAD